MVAVMDSGKKGGLQIRGCKLVLAEAPLKYLEQVLGRGHTLEGCCIPFISEEASAELDNMSDTVFLS